jgi:hypothetical protein
MAHFKIRLFALVLILVSAGLCYYNWYQLNTEGRYSTKLAVFTPVCILGGLFLMIMPTKVGKPATTLDKVIALGVFGVGILAGLVNLYLMDPGFFGQ